MKPSKPESLGHLLPKKEYLNCLRDEYGDEAITNYETGVLMNALKKIIGPVAYKRTGNFRFQQGFFYVKVYSYPLRGTLFDSRQDIINRLNQEVGSELVKGLRLL